MHFIGSSLEFSHQHYLGVELRIIIHLPLLFLVERNQISNDWIKLGKLWAKKKGNVEPLLCIVTTYHGRCSGYLLTEGQSVCHLYSFRVYKTKMKGCPVWGSMPSMVYNIWKRWKLSHTRMVWFWKSTPSSWPSIQIRTHLPDCISASHLLLLPWPVISRRTGRAVWVAQAPGPPVTQKWGTHFHVAPWARTMHDEMKGSSPALALCSWWVSSYQGMSSA